MRLKTLVSALILLNITSSSIAQNSGDTYLRVAVLKGADKLTLSVKGGYDILTLKSGNALSKGRNLRLASIMPTHEGFKIDDVIFRTWGARIIPKKDGTISINGRKFRGKIDIIRTKDGLLSVINFIDVEDYLKGVLYHEVSHMWPIEALKAQAIVSRTFALYQKAHSKNLDYDLTSDIYSQVYGGKTSEKYVTNKAIKLTEGEILTFDGKIFPTYFHATCGGRTEDSGNLWKMNLEPLEGVYCTFCKESPHFNWNFEIPLSRLQEKLSKTYVDISNIISITINSRNASGRIDSLTIITASGKLLVSGKDLRELIGPNNLRSTNYTIEISDDVVKFRGVGWGHGVGMCQWGAYGMAKKGVKVDEILKFYYPGSKIEKFKLSTETY